MYVEVTFFLTILQKSKFNLQPLVKIEFRSSLNTVFSWF